MQLRLAAFAIVIASAGAHAQAPSETAPVPETPAASSDTAEWPTGGGRIGLYDDSDRTTVVRALANVAKTFGQYSVTVGAVVDAITSASIDVRSSPIGKVDVMTSASGQSSTSGGKMSDTRYLGTLGGGWKDSDGHAVNLTTAVASERDYKSVSGGINGSIDVLQRNATLLGGITVTDNRISSVLDPNVHRKMAAVAWSAGAARVLTPSDAIRLRYDGKVSSGYQASPYRAVRFGDWSTTTGLGGQLMFNNTIGAADGLPERLPELRISHAATFEWVHALRLGLGLHPAVRVSHDTWGINTVSPSVELRFVTGRWRIQAGYRYYRQSRAEFFAPKYANDPSTYTNYTSDKELGSQTGQLGTIDVAKIVGRDGGPNENKMLLYFHGEWVGYKYPGFALLSERTSTFLEFGVGWEL